MRNYLIVLAGLTAAAMALVLMPRLLATRGIEPLAPNAAATGGAALPADSTVIEAASATAVAPFAPAADPLSATGQVLTQPKGTRSTDRPGRATFVFDLTEGGRVNVWLRANWRDACSNSVSLLLDEQPEVSVGQDAVYNVWHWVPAGQHELTAGRHTLVVREREDGIALDQILLTRDAAFLPTGPIVAHRAGAGIRRFADDFARSPGHGIDDWDAVSGRWEIAFSFDPNRIPNQYSLTGTPAPNGDRATIQVKGPVWKGCSLSFSVAPLRDGRFGAVLDRDGTGTKGLNVGFEVRAGKTNLQITGGGIRASVPLDAALQPNQWYRVDIQRWAWVLRVTVDDRLVFCRRDLEPATGAVGFFVAEGAAAFDDVKIDEAPWLVDSASERQIPWTPTPGSQWFRTTDPRRGLALVGRRGSVALPDLGLPVAELLLNESGAAPCTVSAASSSSPLPSPAPASDGWRTFSWPGDGVSLTATTREVRIRRAAVRLGQPVPEVFRFGPYTFNEPEIPDPSDYLDFTPAEYQRMQQSGEDDKLRREAKSIYLVAAAGEKTVWFRERGRWTVADGMLTGTGRDAMLRFWQELCGALDVHLRVMLDSPEAAAEVVLHERGESGPTVRIGGPRPPATGQPAARLWVEVPADGKWHDVTVTADDATVSAAGASMPVQPDYGGGLLLKVAAGTVRFDSVEVTVPRRCTSAQGEEEFFYAFDRRETDWRRDGGAWLDHGGISCVLASNWLSLVAPDGEGMAWNTRRFTPDLLLAVTVEENTEWFGWTQEPSHVHHPFDNIRLTLATAESPDRGYRLEVNARDRSATVLYRDGKEVAAVSEDSGFPLRYHGGHAPYSPRRDRIKLLKWGNVIRAFVNGVEVLQYTDPTPLAVERVGFGGYRTRINFSHVLVRELPPPGETR